ncbi:MAG: endonuclease/exonuclease/phosphatase family protein [Verrucomicrobia bacterium]|nr:endonuclease/exonuclease/phosphatase family protein [Verrucomicrobiota bacterium]
MRTTARGLLGALLVLTFHAPSFVLAAAPQPADDKVPRSAIERGLEWMGPVLTETDFTLWGASPITDDAGKVHLYVARWPETNVDPAWRKSAEIAHYIADRPQGPFVFRDVALRGSGAATWDRFAPSNPEIRRFGDTYALLYIANDDWHQPPHPANQRIGMAVAKSPDGPWRRVGRDGLILGPSPDPDHWTFGSQVVNPTLVHFGGKFLLYFKARNRSQAGTVYGVAVSQQLDGPYQISGGPLTTGGVTIEDGCAFVWKNKVCLISTDNHGSVTGIRGGGALWVSDDGLKFNTAWTQIAYGRIPAYDQEYDAKRVKRIYGGDPKLERPKILMQDGQPAWLYAPSGWNITGGNRTAVHLLKVNLAGDAGPLPPVADRETRRVSVMSFNILEAGGNAAHVGFPDAAFGGSRRDDIATIIRDSGADIVGVQECGAVAPLLRELGANWHGIGTGKSVYTGALVSKFPSIPLVTEDFLTAARAELPDGGGLVVVNCHWWPPKDSGAALIRKRLRAGDIPDDLSRFESEVLAASDASRGPRGYLRTLEVLRPYLKSGESVILTGDFNESSHLDWTARAAASGIDRWVTNPTGRPLRFKMAWQGSRLLADAGMHDAYRTVFPDEVAKPGVTWTPPYPDGVPGRGQYGDQVLERIDRIYFAGKDIRVERSAIIGESATTCDVAHPGPWVSDHRATIAVFHVGKAVRRAGK